MKRRIFLVSSFMWHTHQPSRNNNSHGNEGNGNDDHEAAAKGAARATATTSTTKAMTAAASIHFPSSVGFPSANINETLGTGSTHITLH